MKISSFVKIVEEMYEMFYEILKDNYVLYEGQIWLNLQ